MMNNILKKKFIVTSNVKKYFYFDGINKKFKIPSNKIFKKNSIFNFDELLDFDVIEENYAIANKKYCEVLEIKIITKNCNKYIKLIEKPTKMDCILYKKILKDAQEILNTLQFIKVVKKAVN